MRYSFEVVSGATSFRVSITAGTLERAEEILRGLYRPSSVFVKE